MKKLILGVVALVALVAVVGVLFGKPIALAFASPETRACAKVADLCAPGREAQASDLDSCHSAWSDMRRIAGTAEVDKSLACVEGAETCARATGCMLGGVGVGIAKELFKGLGDAATR